MIYLQKFWGIYDIYTYLIYIMPFSYSLGDWETGKISQIRNGCLLCLFFTMFTDWYKFIIWTVLRIDLYTFIITIKKFILYNLEFLSKNAFCIVIPIFIYFVLAIPQCISTIWYWIICFIHDFLSITLQPRECSC